MIRWLTDFLKELREKAKMNEDDAKLYEYTEAERHHTRGFADAQRWVIRRVEHAMKAQGFCACSMCVGAEVRHGLGKRLMSRK